MKRDIVFCLLLCVMSVLSAQKVQKVTGVYTYYAPENVTLEEAKRTALERAKLTAIADAFGTVVSQSNSTVLTNENGRSDNRFLSLGGSEVKGEWIETTKEPEYNISYEGGMLVVSVTVNGRVREITHAGVDIVAKVLRNGTEEKFESCEFRSGDDMYLYFQSPVDGYLAVYLLDDTMQEVFCLLPYKASDGSAYKIKHDIPYVFFSTKFDTVNPNIVDEYTMTSYRDVEYNSIYVLFSQKAFAKVNTNASVNEVLPQKLLFDDFFKWLANTKKTNNMSNVKIISIKISK